MSAPATTSTPAATTATQEFGNPLRKFKLVFLGEQSGNIDINIVI